MSLRIILLKMIPYKIFWWVYTLLGTVTYLLPKSLFSVDDVPFTLWWDMDSFPGGCLEVCFLVKILSYFFIHPYHHHVGIGFVFLCFPFHRTNEAQTKAKISATSSLKKVCGSLFVCQPSIKALSIDTSVWQIVS